MYCNIFNLVLYSRPELTGQFQLGQETNAKFRLVKPNTRCMCDGSRADSILAQLILDSRN